MTQTILLIPGDGIGQEVIPAAAEVLDALDLPLRFEQAEAGFTTFERTGSALPAETLDRCRRADSILFGATQSPLTKVEGYASPILSLRRELDLFANLRPVVGEGVDMLIVRENTEGLYSRREHVEDGGDTAIAERVITRKASERIVRLACEQAMSRPRRKLTLIHKANVLKETCGLFRQVGLSVAAEYPQLEVNELLIDTAAMWMVMDPGRFDVLVTTNLFGDILSDLGAGLVGGLGIAPSANVGAGQPGLFEPVHGSAPDIAGKGLADPRAAILSAALALEHLGYVKQAAAVSAAAYGTAHSGSTRLTTEQIVEKVRSA